MFSNIMYSTILPAVTAVCPGVHPGRDDVYNMTSSPRGVALIINNKTFDRNPSMRFGIRGGSDQDVVKAKELFQCLGFEVQIKEDLAKSEFLDELHVMSRDVDHSIYDCFVLWLMSHGDKDLVYSRDGEEILLETVRDMFSNSSCQSLKGKPKIFFIQACRGLREEFVVADKPYPIAQKNDSPCEGKEPPVYHIPDHADFLEAYSSVDGFVSYRNEDRGSFYVQVLVDVFREHVARDHLVSLLTKVNRRVSKMQAGRVRSEGKVKQVKQMCEYTSRLTKDLYF